MEHFIAIIGFAVLCGAWVLYQRWMSRVDRQVGKHPHCGGGCSSAKLREIERDGRGT